VEPGHPDLQAELLARHQARQALKVMAIVAFLAVAIGGSIYLALPRPMRLAQGRAHKAQIRTTAVTNEPGTVDLQVERDHKLTILRTTSGQGGYGFQDVTPKPPRRWWWPWGRGSGGG
jgi:hypothetical protein